jgi:hypothetical protein
MSTSRKTCLSATQVAAVARLFSSTVVRELAAGRGAPLFARLAKASGIPALSLGAQPARVRDLFDAAFGVLRQRDHRHEYIYKAALTHRVLLGTHSLRTAALLTEFRVGDCKADVVILNGTSTVYEIKSERDRLHRLEKQVNAYRAVFAQVNVVVGENHLARVLALVPEDVGVLVLTDRFQLSTVRPARASIDRISPAAVFDSLRRNEARQILERCGRRIPELPNTRMTQALRSLFVELSAEEVHDGFVTVLRKTRSALPLRDVLEAMPTSLQAAALSVRLNRQERGRLVRAMDVGLDEALSWS